ncbi:hypothetical protein Hanom_Chr00s044022g01775731 [Helianthus anomalus]
MKLQNLSKIIHVLLIFLCFINHGSCTHSFLPEKSGIVLHDQVIIRVGVVLDMDSWIGKSIHSFLTFSITDFYARNNNYRTRIVLHTRDFQSFIFKRREEIWNDGKELWCSRDFFYGEKEREKERKR